MIKWPNFRKKVPPAPNNVRKDPAVRFCWHVNATSFSFRRFLWSFFLPPPTFTSCSHHQFLSHLRRLFPPTHASADTSDQDWWIKRWTQLELTKCVLQSGKLHFFHSYIKPNMQANKRVHTRTNVWILTLQQEVLTKTLTTAVRLEEQQAAGGVLVRVSAEYEILRSHILSFALHFSHALARAHSLKKPCVPVSVFFSPLCRITSGSMTVIWSKHLYKACRPVATV